ncbi:MAG: hypothetical protein NTY77_19905 [Elusimicrobia bacterium]|nr:hypothetical protein [Elusimicrobiota bacterium]
MRLSLRFFLCLAGGIAAGLSGWALVKSPAAPAEKTGFVSLFSPAWFLGFFSSATLRPALGWLLLFVAAFLICMLAPMFYIAG